MPPRPQFINNEIKTDDIEIFSSVKKYKSVDMGSNENGININNGLWKSNKKAATKQGKIPDNKDSKKPDFREKNR
jgi:hypothetical protein